VRKALQITGIGLSALLGNRARSALTMLGIVIGVAAVILITSLGNGVQAQVTGQLDELGPNLITVSPGSDGEQGFGDEGDGGPGGPGGGPGGAVTTLTTGDARAVEALPSVSAASPSVSVPVTVGRASYTFTGVVPSYARISSVELETGRFVEREKELVLTADAAKDLLNSDPKGAIGEKLVVGGREYEVVGISKEATGGGFAAQPAASYMLVDDALALSGAENVSQIVALAGDRDAVAAAADDISAELQDRHGGAEDFSVITQEQLLSSFSQITDLLTYALAGIAGISLLVGGIGVMNIMLVSVTERSREIGVRKALGATNGDVLSQFLLEAVLLSVLGGLVGIAIGVGVSALLPILSSNLPTAVTWAAVGLASGVSVLIGVVFGVLPAYRSARLQPVEALRRE